MYDELCVEVVFILMRHFGDTGDKSFSFECFTGLCISTLGIYEFFFMTLDDLHMPMFFVDWECDTLRDFIDPN